MAELVLLTNAAGTPQDVLGSLGLLPHTVRMMPAEPAAVAGLPSCDLVLLDGRADLVATRTLCRLLAGTATPVLLVLTEGGLSAVATDWGMRDVVLYTAGPAELAARIRLAAEGAASAADHSPAEIVVGGLRIDEQSYSARLRGRPLDLTYKEFELLKYLAQHPSRVLSRAQLLQEVWGYDYFGGTRTVDVHIRRLRAKLGTDHEIIGTVRNVGYRMVPDASAEEELTWAQELDTGRIASILDAARACATVDGAQPLSEAAELALRHASAKVHHVLIDGPAEMLGYAQLRVVDAQVEGFVVPQARGRGLGGRLADAVVAHPQLPAVVTAWAHGDLPAASRLAVRVGARRQRQLWQMSRPATDPLPVLEIPGGWRLRAFRPGLDEAAWLELNAAAFADHPEQGRWTAADLARRQDQPWWNPDGLILAEDIATGGLLAAHWTKIDTDQGADPVGEVYVVGVSPSAQGRGLGRLITLAGLHYLQQAASDDDGRAPAGPDRAVRR
ncbi:MAG: mycothiol synthase [Micrococcales bacterium]|nr:MAG: mycothiol synthase [Micrococcales bacterium]